MRAGQEGARSAARPCPGCSPPAPAAPPAVSWRSRRRCTVCALEGETPVFVSAPLSAGQAPRQLGLETFLTQESNLHLLNWGSILYLLRHRGSLISHLQGENERTKKTSSCFHLPDMQRVPDTLL
ncbi:uncharacterized protein ACBT57_000840 isoform 2-T2 [Dama dama]